LYLDGWIILQDKVSYTHFLRSFFLLYILF
jgi:hypothetical protein